MASRSTWKLMDRSLETSSVTLTGPTLTGANYDAQIAEVAGISATLQAITLAEVQKQTVVSYENAISADIPTSPYANRELKLLFSYNDTVTGRRGSFTVPAPDLASLTLGDNSDEVDLADAGVMAAFVTAVEGWALSEAGNTINITSARIVGRNL